MLRTCPPLQGKEKESAARIKRFMTIMDSMTDKELDTPNPKVLEEPSRVLRLARGSGSHPHYVFELLGAHARACMHAPAPACTCTWLHYVLELLNARACACMRAPAPACTGACLHVAP
jgi:hypothetical protein